MDAADIRRLTTEADPGLFAEFARRLQYQLELNHDHNLGCTLVNCRTGTLIAAGLADSWTTLVGMGYQREANEITSRFEEDHT